ncbi:MAG: endonuclease III [Bacteroidetes bacterium]|nr:endonuclease III [Bacteroidota bacterium]
MTTKKRYRLFIEHFSKANPTAETELHYSNPFELLVAVILSAQCTDKRVNIVTKDLFRRFTNAKELAEADVEEVFEYIKSISYPNNKAKHLVGMAKILVNEFKSIVPADVDDLQKMPGVGRKTAHVIASVIYQKPVMAVDTHVFRVANRLGLTINAKTPLEAEKQLTKHLPDEVIHVAHHWLILHGRYVCVARKPKCASCEIAHFCKSYGKFN